MANGTNGRERIRKSYARLFGLKEGMKPDRDGWLEGAQATDFNKALDHLVAEGFDVDEFRIHPGEIEEIWGRQVIRSNTLTTRLEGLLAYFTIAVTPPANPGSPPSRRI